MRRERKVVIVTEVVAIELVVAEHRLQELLQQLQAKHYIYLLAGVMEQMGVALEALMQVTEEVLRGFLEVQVLGQEQSYSLQAVVVEQGAIT
jgi:hypothetical protein